MKTKKKTFELSSIKKYKRYERMLWLIPPAWAVLGFKQLFLDNLQLVSNGVTTVICIIVYYLSGVIILSAIPFFIGKIVIRTKIKSAIQNCTITSLQDFDYYRDKLTGISPATISLLTDLDIEQEKDVSASVLQYENLGILVKDQNNTYHTTPKFERCTELNESDRYLIEHIIKDDFDWANDTRWKQLVMDEAIAEGYIARKEPLWDKVMNANNENDPKQDKSFKVKIWLIKLLLAALWILWIINAYPRIMELKPVFEVPPGRSLAEHLNIFYSQPDLLLAFAETIALFISAMFIICFKPKRKPKSDSSSSKKGCLVPAMVFLFWIIWIFSELPTLLSFDIDLLGEPEKLFSQPEQMRMFLELMPLLVFSIFILSYVFSAPHLVGIMTGNMKSIQRTDYGNQMAECIYGMKNFIHDYSNLSEADRRQVVLWEDYLVYAVVLEENEGIVNEITRTRRTQ